MHPDAATMRPHQTPWDEKDEAGSDGIWFPLHRSAEFC